MNAITCQFCSSAVQAEPGLVVLECWPKLSKYKKGGSAPMRIEGYGHGLGVPQATTESLRVSVELSLSELECAELQCWCFTRAAMAPPLCECANCRTWRALAAALDILAIEGPATQKAAR